jgi:hypothetical protein
MTTTPSSFPNVICWNRAARPEVFSTDALRTAAEVFHATHSPAYLHQEGIAAGTLLRIEEGDYVKDFLLNTDPLDLDVVAGDSGTGKSHLIRWIEQEARRLNPSRNSRWSIVLIPRASANLADVIRRIIEGFEGPVVSKVRRELDQASRRISPAEGRRRVLFEVEQVLRTDDFALPDDLADLPDLLHDVVLSRSLVDSDDGVLTRLSGHFFGKRERVDDVEPDRLRWRADDLQFTARQAQRSSPDIRELANHLMADDTERQRVADILNAVTPSLSGLLGLRRGDLGRAMEEIRRELRRHDRELVLCIEDMSVTQGVDAELLEAIAIPHPDTGRSVCRSRAVVGLTNENYDDLRNNIRSRIRKTVRCNVPVAMSDSDHDGGLGREELARFAARYLNATRFSLEELRRWSNAQETRSEPLPSYCPRCPNLAACHASFGAAEVDGEIYGLYPFTSQLLMRLYGKATRLAPGIHAGELRAFNPRRLVGGVLNEVLAEAEQTVPASTFPSRHLIDKFALGVVDLAVARRLNTQHGNTTGERLVNALELYAPEPSVADPILISGIAEALALPAVLADPLQAWAAGSSLSSDLASTLRQRVHAVLLPRLASALRSRFPSDSIRFDGMPGTGSPLPLLTVRRSPETAEVLRRLLGTPQLDTIVAERWYAAWADEVSRRLNGQEDEFDRWLAGGALPRPLVNELRQKLWTTLTGLLASPDLDRAALRFEPEQRGPDRHSLFIERAEPGIADVLRELRLWSEGSAPTWSPLVINFLRQCALRLAPAQRSGPDPFTLWANGGAVEDINRWRVLVYEAIEASIDWDTEEGVAPLKADFQRRNIHFEGQFEQARPSPVEVRIPRSIEAGLALRTLDQLRNGTLGTDSPEGEITLLDLSSWVAQRADDVRNQLRRLLPARTSPEVLRVAGRLLALAAIIRGRVAPGTSRSELLARLFEPWPTTDAEPMERTPPWRNVWLAYRSKHAAVRELLLDALTCAKGGSLQARIVDPSPLLSMLDDVLRAPSPGALPHDAGAWPHPSPVLQLYQDVSERLPAAVHAEYQAVVEWLRRLREFLGSDSPFALADILEPTLREAMNAGVLRGEGALELRDRCLQLPPLEVGKAINAVAGLESSDGQAHIFELARLDQQLMRDYVEFLEAASRVVDASLTDLEGEPDTAPDVAALEHEVEGLLTRLNDALTRLSS